MILILTKLQNVIGDLFILIIEPTGCYKPQHNWEGWFGRANAGDEVHSVQTALDSFDFVDSILIIWTPHYDRILER